MKKFWTMKADAGETAEIYIYGDIASRKHDDLTTTAKSFIDDLSALNGKDLIVHLNSYGGDVYTAIAIFNAIKNYSGHVTTLIDGIAASAASLIALAGDKVKSARNALIMLHEPHVLVMDFMTLQDLAKVQKGLEACVQSIITTYETRLKGQDIKKMLAEETYLSAEEALELGFIDEITENEAKIQVDAAQNKLFVNSLVIDCAKINLKKLEMARRGEKMNIKSEIIAAITEMAQKNNYSAAQIEPYLEMIKGDKKVETPKNELIDVIADQMSSGSAGVKGGAGKETDIESAQILKMKALAKEMWS